MVFEEKYFCYIILTDKISLLDCLNLVEILGNMPAPVCDVINFGISLNLLIKLFFYITKNSRQKFKYLKNEKSF